MDTAADQYVLRGSKLSQYLASHVPTAKELICLTDCEPLGMAELLALSPETEAELKAASFCYSDPRGDESLRARIAALYETLGPAQVRVENGGGEALLNLMSALLRRGEHVIVHFPSFPPLYQIPRALGCDVTLWEADPHRRWALDLDFLAASLRPNTRAVILNFPHNPTGYQPSAREFRDLVGIVRENGAYLIGDEVYRMPDEPATALPATADSYEKGISVGSFSKSFGLPGIRVGWMATRNAEALAAQSMMKGLNTTCNSTLGQIVAGAALTNLSRILARNRGILHENLGIFEKFLGENEEWIDGILPLAGPVAFPRLRRHESSREFCARLFQANGTLVVPSAVMDYGDRHVRIGLGRRSFAAGLAKLGEFLREAP